MSFVPQIYRKILSLRQNLLRKVYSVNKNVDQDQNYLARRIFQKIEIKGPITVADYMKEVLTNPAAGYYMHRDVFGEAGDFITSPEISQIFGEMIAVWLINEWQKMGSPKPFQIIEMGPGRGTLASDILKVFNHFKLNQTTLHLVEVSPHLSEIQAKRLCGHSTFVKEQETPYRHGTAKEGVEVNWHKQLCDVPKGFSLFIAHEFFDALPIHKFQKTNMGYKEVLIDIDIGTDISNKSEHPKFRYVLARNPTPIQHSVINSNEKRDHLEVSPESMLLYRDICERIKNDGGLALICDYGHDGTGTDTFRAFRKHKQVDPLEYPGSSDLTADVDFNAIKQMASQVEGVLTFGPITQREFLLKTGLDVRVQRLKQTITDQKQLDNITECYKSLTDTDKMGERFKFFALIPETMKPILDVYPMVGFSEK